MRALRAWKVVTVVVVACTPSHPAPNDEKASAKPPAAASPPTVTAPATPAPQPAVMSIGAKDGPPKALVVLLHGVGADAASFHRIALALAPAVPSADFVTLDGFEPFDRAATGRQWFSMTEITDGNRAARIRVGAEAVSSWIDNELDKRGLGHDRVAVVGFSQGAMIAGWLAIHRSPAPAAVVMFSGRVSDDETPTAGKVATPVLMAHGTDDARIPVWVVEPGVKILEAWGARVTKKVYPQLGHQIDDRELADAKEFLKAALRPN